MHPFDFRFLNGSESLSLHISKNGIRSGNWVIKPKLLPPEVYSVMIIYDIVMHQLWCTREFL